MNITLSIHKPTTFAEVYQVTSYVGAKMEEDPDAFDRISTVDENEPLLARYWEEARAALVSAINAFFVNDGMSEEGDNYELVLNVADTFNVAMQPSMQIALGSYFVNFILARWFMIVNKEESDVYMKLADGMLDDVKRKAINGQTVLRRKLHPW